MSTFIGVDFASVRARRESTKLSEFNIQPDSHCGNAIRRRMHADSLRDDVDVGIGLEAVIFLTPVSV